MNDRQEFEKQIKRYVNERSKVLEEVETFRETLLSNFKEALNTAEAGIQNSVIGTDKEPEIYTVVSPHEHLGREKQDELLIAVSSAFLEQNQRNFSKKPLYEILKQLEHEHGFEDLTAEASEKIYGNMESSRDLIKGKMRYWAAEYRSEENIILLNELPEEILPSENETPPISEPLRKGLSSSIEYNLGRNHNWPIEKFYRTIVHEMTHAFLSVQLKLKKGQDPMEKGNKTLQALDEAVAGMTGYVLTNRFPESDYSDKGIPQRELEQFREMYREYCDRKLKEHEKKEVISKMRAHALFTAISIMNGTDPRKAFKEEIR